MGASKKRVSAEARSSPLILEWDSSVPGPTLTGQGIYTRGRVDRDTPGGDGRQGRDAPVLLAVLFGRGPARGTHPQRRTFGPTSWHAGRHAASARRSLVARTDVAAARLFRASAWLNEASWLLERKPEVFLADRQDRDLALFSAHPMGGEVDAVLDRQEQVDAGWASPGRRRFVFRPAREPRRDRRRVPRGGRSAQSHRARRARPARGTGCPRPLVPGNVADAAGRARLIVGGRSH